MGKSEVVVQRSRGGKLQVGVKQVTFCFPPSSEPSPPSTQQQTEGTSKPWSLKGGQNFSKQFSYGLNFVNNSRKLKVKVTEDQLEKAWKALGSERCFGLEEAARELFGGTSQGPLELYTAHRLLRIHFPYFKRLESGKFTCRTPAERDSLQRHNELLQNEELCREITAEVRARIGGVVPSSSHPMYPVFEDALRRFALSNPRMETMDDRFFSSFLFPFGFKSRPSDAFQLGTMLGVFLPHDNYHRLKKEVDTDLFHPFSAKTMEAAQTFFVREQELADQGIPVFSSDPIFAIDSSTTTEVDDGISIELRENDPRPWIRVHIADVTRFVRPGELLDLEARTRVTSIYLPEWNVSMFPSAFAVNVLSLNERNPSNHAFTFSARLNEDGSISEFHITPSIVKNLQRATYEEVEETLSGGPTRFTPRQVSSLRELALWAERRKAYRERNGAVSFQMPQQEITVTDGGRSVDIKISNSPVARGLVQEMMILGGEVAATYAQKSGLSIAFRIQRAPEDLAPAPSPKPTDEGEAMLWGWEQSHLMTAAITGAEAELHFAIGLPQYTRATSPIRRYSDIIVHNQLRSHLLGRSPPFTDEAIAKLAPLIDEREKEIRRLQKRSEKFWTLRYLMAQGFGRQYPGTVLEVRKRLVPMGEELRASVLLDNLGFIAQAPVVRDLVAGSRLTLQLEEANNFFSKFAACS